MVGVEGGGRHGCYNVKNLQCVEENQEGKDGKRSIKTKQKVDKISQIFRSCFVFIECFPPFPSWCYNDHEIYFAKERGAGMGG